MVVVSCIEKNGLLRSEHSVSCSQHFDKFCTPALRVTLCKREASLIKVESNQCFGHKHKYLEGRLTGWPHNHAASAWLLTMIIVSCVKFLPLEQASNPVRIKSPHNKGTILNWKTERGEKKYTNISSLGRKKEQIKEKKVNMQAHSGDCCESWETRWTTIHTYGTSVV